MTKVSTDDFLAHYGVKGMKWGKRKQRALESNERLASGKGTFGDKAKLAATVSGTELVRGKGSGQAIAQRRLERLQAKKAKAEAAGAAKVEKSKAQVASTKSKGRKVAEMALLGPVGYAIVNRNSSSSSTPKAATPKEKTAKASNTRKKMSGQRAAEYMIFGPLGVMMLDKLR